VFGYTLKMLIFVMEMMEGNGITLLNVIDLTMYGEKHFYGSNI